MSIDIFKVWVYVCYKNFNNNQRYKKTNYVQMALLCSEEIIKKKIAEQL